MTLAHPPAALRGLFERVLAGEHLDEDEASRGLVDLTDPELSTELKAAFLTALRMKGETADELRGLARAMRDLAVPVRARGTGPLVDTCGTGGDGSHSFNVSTATALLTAAGGLRVAKHGNRAVSSTCGSADLVRGLGLPLLEDPLEAARAIDEHGFAFLFAPAFHPATAAVAGVRRSLATRTVFNLLGPLANPARPTHQLIGACHPAAARLLAGAARGLELERAFVVHGEPGWDEATPVGPFLLLDVRAGKVRERRVDPESFGIAPCRPEDLVGGGSEENAQLLERVFAGEAGPLRDSVVLNAALVQLLVGRTEDPREAARLAALPLDDGRATRFLQRLREASKGEVRA